MDHRITSKSRIAGCALFGAAMLAPAWAQQPMTPYERKHPKPVPAAQVARAVISAVEGNRAEKFVSPILRQAVVTKALVPALFGWGTSRTFARELAAERARRDVP